MTRFPTFAQKQHIIYVESFILQSIENSEMYQMKAIPIQQFQVVVRNNYFYIEKWTFKGMCGVYYQVKRDKKEPTNPLSLTTLLG